MKYLVNDSVDPYYNMAFDEFCLEKLDCEPLFCLWRNAPSVIIGYNQVAEQEVNLAYLKEHGIHLVRRTTGGGAVYHDLQNLNYSFYGPIGMSPQPIADALRSFGVDAQLSGRNDIFVGGRKVSGYARRLYRNRELVHGTLMYDVDIDTLTRALDTPVSKLHGKGVASVRSRVTNLKDFLPFRSLEEFAAALHDFLACGDGEYVLDASQRSEILRNTEK